MPSRCFTLMEVLIVTAVIVILCALLTGPLQQAVKASRKASCMNNLMQQGRMLAQYRQMFAHAPCRTPADPADDDYNPTTLAPYVSFAACGLLDNPRLAACPVGEIRWRIADLSEPGLGLRTQQDRPASQLTIHNDTHAASQYLFTLFHELPGPSARIIAADAADAADPAVTGVPAFTPNHGDRPDRKEDGGNALFQDGHATAVPANGICPQASDPSNLWSEEGGAVTAPNLITRIGHY